MNKTVLAIGIIFLLICVSGVSSNVNIRKVFYLGESNNPPYSPDNPNPIGPNATICGNLSWTGGDPDGDDVTYDVYFGNNPENMTQRSWNQSETWFNFSGILKFEKTYYWYIVAWDEYGLSNTSSIWSFTTEENLPPYWSGQPFPFDGDPYVPTENVICCWFWSDPNECDILRFDVYFDDVNPPQTQQLWMSSKYCWEIEFELDEYETYYWRVDAYDSGGLFTEGPVWSFITGKNHPPTDPIIDGKKTGRPNVEYDFTFFSIDPENHSIKYHVKWGDGTEGVTGLFHNNDTLITLSHSWGNEGGVTIKARACDEYDLCSNWSEYSFTVSRNKIATSNMLLLRIIERFTSLQKFLEISYVGN